MALLSLPTAPATRTGHVTILSGRRLAHRDRISARLAELVTIADLLTTAAARVHAGWCQDAWVDRTDRLPGERAGVCLVTAVRVSAPVLDLEPVSQPVNRAVDVAWHTLYRDTEGIRRVAPPDVRLARVRDLARWNDRAGRSAEEVSDLLVASAGSADRERLRLQAAY